MQANKYEGYVVWINALVEGAGGHILEDAGEGVDAKITLGDDAGEKAAAIIEKLATSGAAPADLSVSNEGTAGSTFGSDQGSFLVNWTYIWHNYDDTAPDVAKDIGYAPLPARRSRARSPVRPTAASASASAPTPTRRTSRSRPRSAWSSPESQGINADITGNMPASTQGYEYPKLKEQYPADLLQLFQKSVDAAAPRTVTPYWSDVSGCHPEHLAPAAVGRQGHARDGRRRSSRTS